MYQYMHTKTFVQDHCTVFVKPFQPGNFVFQGSDDARASIFTGEEELFAFDSVVSRLVEMQTEEYWVSREIGKQEAMKEKAEQLAAQETNSS